MDELRVEFLGHEFDNPFIIGSASPTVDGAHMRKIVEKGWGSYIVKTLSLDKNVRPDVRPRLSGMGRYSHLFGLQNCELITTHTLDWWERELRMLRDLDSPMIVSIMATPELEDWATMGRWCEENGADIIELNVSCPHGCPEEHMGSFIGQDPQLVHDVTKAVKDDVSIPVMTKLTPNVTDIVPVGKAAKKGGADALSTINTVGGINGVDIYNRIPAPYVLNKGTISGNSGPAMRTIAYKWVSELAANINLPISGIGGIDSWEAATGMMMLGASTTQVVTAAMVEGFDIVQEWKRRLAEFMREQGYETIEDIVGKALPSLSDYEHLEVEDHLYPEIDDTRCIQCQRCRIACADTGGEAIITPYLNEIDDDKCLGCALCKTVCPVDAISMVVRDGSLRWTRKQGPPTDRKEVDVGLTAEEGK
ncbi:NAD-dependent dihydropyrimidine dehydrogenase subunit PreA [archaeon]|nr:MAG: NAD-dependent dihydropyrimidine dehydrogenase subunit PreA [archaeon]